jgi:hypothetical protein
MTSPTPEVAPVKRVWPWIWLVVALVAGYAAGFISRPMIMAMSQKGPSGTCLRSDTTTVFSSSISQADCQSKCGPDCWWQQN